MKLEMMHHLFVLSLLIAVGNSMLSFYNAPLSYPANVHVLLAEEFYGSEIQWGKYFFHIQYLGGTYDMHNMHFQTYAQSVEDNCVYVQWPPMILLINPDWMIFSVTMKKASMHTLDHSISSDDESGFDSDSASNELIDICPESFSYFLHRFFARNPHVQRP